MDVPKFNYNQLINKYNDNLEWYGGSINKNGVWGMLRSLTTYTYEFKEISTNEFDQIYLKFLNEHNNTNSVQTRIIGLTKLKESNNIYYPLCLFFIPVKSNIVDNNKDRVLVVNLSLFCHICHEYSIKDNFQKFYDICNRHNIIVLIHFIVGSIYNNNHRLMLPSNTFNSITVTPTFTLEDKQKGHIIKDYKYKFDDIDIDSNKTNEEYMEEYNSFVNNQNNIFISHNNQNNKLKIEPIYYSL